MKFVLFRHAHKSFLPFEDPELSAEGHQQALRLLELTEKNELPHPTQLVVSPKRRASQTFYPISKCYQTPLNVSLHLDQRLHDESSSEFRNRVSEFLNSLQKKITSETDVVYACTHYDWIEEAMTLIDCDRDLNSFEFAHWSPTQYAAFSLSSETKHWAFLKKGDAK